MRTGGRTQWRIKWFREAVVPRVFWWWVGVKPVLSESECLIIIFTSLL